MPNVSVIIPARNEMWLLRTVESIRAAIRGDTEIVVVIDGEEAEPRVPDDWGPGPDVRVLRVPEPIGQRQAINLAARASIAKYLLKTDAHSILDEGFDVKLAADCEPDWTVIPTMYNLHGWDLVCKGCGRRFYNRGIQRPCPQCGSAQYDREVIWQPNRRRKTDWMWFRSPLCKDRPMRVQYWGQSAVVCTACGHRHDAHPDGGTCDQCGAKAFIKSGREFETEYGLFRKWSKQQGPIADVMTGQGACWFLERDRFWALGGLDEGHGSWGQMGVEMACKAWLSGGRQVVNRKTWFAHLFRCGDGDSFPYKQHASDQEKARRYSIDFWTSGRWPLQVHPLEWLAEKFRPVPTWDTEDQRSKIKDVDAVVERRATSDASLLRERRATSDGPTLSVLIPARNEPFLEATVRDLLKNLRTNYEILVGLDGEDQEVPALSDPRVRFLRLAKAGMRPTLNRLLAQAKGRFILKCDAHCAIAEGMDDELIKAWEPGGSVVGARYDLDTDTWQKRDFSKTDCRRLTHASEDGVGLRSMAWPEWAEAHKAERISETMTCSGSMFLIERVLWNYWGGWDEQHGHFGQEGAELACKVWLSGGRLLENKGTWYAHWNRGKATYSMGANVKPKSIARSHDLWMGDRWPFAKYSFAWLIDRFQPPGWPADYEQLAAGGQPVPAIHQGGGCKPFRASVADLWSNRHWIGEPDKRFRLDIFWEAFGAFVDSVLAGKPDYEGPYRNYLIGHLRRGAVGVPTSRDLKIVRGKMHKAARLVTDIRDNGLKSPLEFYRADGRMIQWKGYRRLVILQRLGRPRGVRAIGRSLLDKRTANSLSPQSHLLRLIPPPAGPMQTLCEVQYARHGGDATDKHWVHGYTTYYDRHFAGIRKKARTVLECGLARGASLAIWRQYFPKARIVGFDCDPDRWRKYAGDLPNTAIYLGDERNETDVRSLVDAGPYDVIVDDASHAPEDQRRLWEWLWPSVRPWGWYVIEDIHQGWDRHGVEPCMPQGMERRIFAEAKDIREIHWYYNIVFLQKI